LIDSLVQFPISFELLEPDCSGNKEPVVGAKKWCWLEGALMRSIDFRVPLLAGAAVLLLAFSQAKAAEPIQFVSGTGEAVLSDDSANVPAPAPFADPRASSSDAQAELNEVAEKLSNPKMQDGVANMVERMTENMLDLPIGKFVAAIEQSVPGANKGRKRIRANDTLADIAGRDADRLPDQLADGSRQMMGMLSGFAAAFATMVPELEKMGRDMEKSFEDIEGDARKRD
jgi:hypothetical protein